MPARGGAGRSPRKRRLLACALLALAVPAAAVQGPIRHQALNAPREFGYAIGDEIVLRVRFELARGYRVDMDKLPKAGRVTRWLALNRVHVTRGLGWAWVPHSVTIAYQVVNTPTAVLGVGTPPQSLRVVGEHDDFPVIVPAWGFSIAPITAPSDHPEGALPPLRPALPPPTVDARPIVVRASVAATGFAATLALLAYVHLWLPLVARSREPFARACREIGKLIRRRTADDPYTAALSELHRAFNATAGRVVFAHELDRFFEEHSRFEALREPIVRMFQASNAEFYGEPAEQTSPQRVGALLELCLACRDRERRLS